MAEVPDTSGVIHACVQLSDPDNPPNATPGNLYIIDPSAGQSCSSGGSEIPLDWNFKGPTGAQGPQGQPGSAITVAAPGVKSNASPVVHVVLGTGAQRLSFGLLSLALRSAGATGGAHASHKSTFKEFTIVKSTDKASAALRLAAAGGKHFPTATIEMRKAGGDSQASGKPFLTYKLTDVVISSYQVLQGGGGTSKPEETITLGFSGLRFTRGK